MKPGSASTRWILLLTAASCVTAAWISGCGNEDPEPGVETRFVLTEVAQAIPAGGALTFGFEAEANKRVNITVDSSNPLAEPNFTVVEGTVAFEDLGEVPDEDVVIESADDRRPGLAPDSFTPTCDGEFTIFITEDNNLPDARYSVEITQRR